MFTSINGSVLPFIYGRDGIVVVELMAISFLVSLVRFMMDVVFNSLGGFEQSSNIVSKFYFFCDRTVDLKYHNGNITSNIHG